MLKLNKDQIVYMLNTWFSAYDLLKIFETCDVVWLAEQDFELDTKQMWPEVYMNGIMCTSINNSYYEKEYKKLLKL